MHKELNPELFSEKKSTKTTENAAEPAFLHPDRQFFELKMQNHTLSEQVNKLTQGLNELIKNSNSKWERHQQSIHRLEQSHNGLVFETSQKLNHLASKISERKMVDAKIQEMIDRHNNLVKSFEVRINHMQKLLAEKEAFATAAHAALNEAKMEIARLKRGP